MGYRSEVVIVVPRDSKQAILDIIPEEEWNKICDNETDEYGNGVETTLFYLAATKWYGRQTYKGKEFISGYDEVNKVMDYLTLLDETQGDSKYALVRLGEDIGDFELLGDPYKYGVYINQSIDF